MMSVERSFEAWEEVQRHGLDLADKLAQGFSGLIQSHITPPQFPWPNAQPPKLFGMEFPAQSFVNNDFGLAMDSSAINGVSAIFDIANKIGQAGLDVGACVNCMVHQFLKRLPVPFEHDENAVISLRSEGSMPRNDMGITLGEDLGSLAERFRDYGYTDNKLILENSIDENGSADAKASRLFGRSQGTINFTSTYESRKRTVESTLLARGDLWRVEASQGGTTSGNENSSLFLVQLGPVLFVRDSTLLLPIHLSKQHLLWYGYDRKHGMHSLCPAMWSKHRRWLLMSMICLNPIACSFMDLQFPNGQITYVAGEGVSSSAFLPLCGGLLQAQGQYPGEMRFSFSCQNKLGTRITPMVQWPDKSFSLGLAQSLAWKRSGLMVRPSFQFSLCPTIGGSNPGMQAELTHSLKEELSLTCGCSLVARPTAYASLSLGRSKWNGNVGCSGVVVKVEAPLGDVGSPNFFGVVLLEIVSGKSSTSIKSKQDCFYLLDRSNRLKEEGKLKDLIDQRLGSDYDEVEIMLTLRIALLCTNVKLTNRSSMSSVVSMLEGRGIGERSASELGHRCGIGKRSASEPSSSSKYNEFTALEFSNEQRFSSSNEIHLLEASLHVPFTAASTTAGDLYPIISDSDYLLTRS